MLSATTKEQRSQVKCPVLMSRPYIERDPAVSRYLVEHGDNIDLLVDCGAFTIWYDNKRVYTLDDHCDFMAGLRFPHRYLQLDVVGQPERTIENYREELRRGGNPMPMRDLEEMSETADVVGIGGLFTDQHGVAQYLKWISTNFPPQRAHWLGVTRPKLLNYYLPASADSASWQSSGMYGSLTVYGGNGRWLKKLRCKPPTDS